MPIVGGATGAGLGALVGGPPAAIVGAATGVATAELLFPEEVLSADAAEEAAKQGNPAPGGTGETLRETSNLVKSLGWWYLLLFVLIPIVSKRGRSWIKSINRKWLRKKT